MHTLKSSRTFRVWEYDVSHKQLLLRSPRDGTHSKNIDLVFVGVEYLDLPTSLHGVTIGTAVDTDVGRARDALGKPVGTNEVFVLESGRRRCLVVAASGRIEENDLDLFETSLERFRA